MKRLIKKVLGRAFSPESPLYQAYHSSRGIAAAVLAGFPTRKMIVIGVTGTNGKTTTSNLLANILDETGQPVGLATTVNFWVGNKRWINESKMTTESPFKLQSLLNRMTKANCRYAVIETSSHALAQHRTWGIDYDVAVFTNLTPEHLDFHKTFEQYRDAKAQLFRQLYLSRRKADTPKIAILNFDDNSSQSFAKYPADKKYFYSVNEFTPNTTVESPVTGKIIQTSPMGSTFELSTPAGSTTIELHLPGRFNVANALAAASAALALGLPLDTIKRGLEKVIGVPGRMERIDAGQPFTVIVDYAHTPDGFEQVLSTARGFTSGKLITVFGAAGDRDKSKRPVLGEVASRYSDILILTEEDPGSEDPLAIIQAIKTGIPQSFRESVNLFTLAVRQDAISRAFALAKPGDTVMLLAMGAQTKMAVKHGFVNYDEREFAKNLLRLTVGKQSPMSH
jgi:UDP-N-acetylmuramyl-tripeptide synthetase